MTTRQQISEWFDIGKDSNNEYMIIVCDTFDYEDYPVFANQPHFDRIYSNHNNVNLQRIMEVYNLKMDKETQLNETLTFNIPKGAKL